MPTAKTKESATKDLKTVLNEVVENPNTEIDVIFIYDLDSNMLLEHSDVKKPRGGKMVDSLFNVASDLEMGESLSEFGDIRDLPKALQSFGDETGGGDLKYATFQLSNSIVQAYFLPQEVVGTNAAICFACAQAKGLGKFVLQCEKHYEPIKTALAAMF
ncbi:MAG: hypothetical protein BWK78_02320 [Thiotrichaceae bacterium IS1]|nr:MAG: hypothetical protein BWK78_02320 [Thiotrichaceae bacterium IS1]